MTARCALLIMLALARGCWVILEQPQGSLLERHPARQKLFGLWKFYKKSMKMYDYGGSSDKQTWLYSSHLLA